MQYCPVWLTLISMTVLMMNGCSQRKDSHIETKSLSHQKCLEQGLKAADTFDHRTAEIFLKASLEKAQITGPSSVEMAQSLYTLGHIRFDKERYGKSIIALEDAATLLEQALVIADANSHCPKELQQKIVCELSIVYNRIDEQARLVLVEIKDKHLLAHERQLEIAKAKVPENPQDLGTALLYLGEYYYNHYQPRKAASYLYESIHLVPMPYTARIYANVLDELGASNDAKLVRKKSKLDLK